MTDQFADAHQREVRQGNRFEFGRNWARFLKRMNEERIALAIDSLRRMLGVERLDGRKFLDIGSGSGLFSLAARRLGAIVHSFDYDPESVACTAAMRERYFAGDDSWVVERGSVLDVDYLRSLGRFDVVYSWGVLHHTGDMMRALDNVKALVVRDGLLFIAIYNDQGEITDRWADIKQRYNRLGGRLATAYATSIVVSEEWRALCHHVRNRNVAQWLRTWTDYDKVSMRGMSRWHDWIDWIGGYPYERATIEQIVDHFAKDGYRLENLFDCSGGYGCNEFVLRRVGDLGEFIDVRIPGGTSLVRKFGYRLSTPLEPTVDGLIGSLATDALAGRRCVVLQNDRLLGVASVDADRRLTLNGCDDVEPGGAVYAVEADIRRPTGPFKHQRGHMWSWHVGDLADIADNMTNRRNASPVFLFQDGVQLPLPHSIHEDIVKSGGGRFSHWGDEVLFSTRDGEDPNGDLGRFRLLIARSPS